MEIVRIVVLSLSALLLVFVGVSRLCNPIKTYWESSRIKLEKDINLLNEVRGVSSVMCFSGIIIAIGIFIGEFSITSHIVGILIFMGFALGRILSSKIDGKPGKQISQGIVFEIVLGSANVFCLFFL